MMSDTPATSSGTRDLRLDFFRGLALILIFIDHIPGNFLSNFTLHSIGFSDAAEVFVFISGYTAGLVFGRAYLNEGPLFGAAQVLKRAWTVYVAHVFLFVCFTAEAAWTAETFKNPMFAEEMQVTGFLAEPHIAIIKSLTLQFQPLHVAVLPLYVVLLLALVPVLAMLRWSRPLALGLSAGLYLGVRLVGLDVSSYPEGTWSFNPFAWQLLFFLAVDLSFTGLGGKRAALPGRRWLWLSAGFLAAALATKLYWIAAERFDAVPAWFVSVMAYLDNKADLSPLRLINILCQAHLVSCLFQPDRPRLTAPPLVAIIRCGRHSLHIFCLGVFLSVLAHGIMSEFGASIGIQLIVNVAGIILMAGVAYVMTWYDERAAAGRRRKPLANPPELAGE